MTPLGRCVVIALVVAQSRSSIECTTMESAPWRLLSASGQQVPLEGVQLQLLWQSANTIDSTPTRRRRRHHHHHHHQLLSHSLKREEKRRALSSTNLIGNQLNASTSKGIAPSFNHTRELLRYSLLLCRCHAIGMRPNHEDSRIGCMGLDGTQP